MDKLSYILYQGATFAQTIERFLCPYEVRLQGDVLVNLHTGAPVPQSDLIPDDFTGCKARMQVRPDVLSPVVLFEMTTENGRISFAPGAIKLQLAANDSTAFKYGEHAGAWIEGVGQIEVERPDGTVERPFEIRFLLDPEGTR